MENENKITVTPSLSGIGNLPSDQNTANLDIKMSIKNENKITIIPTLSGKRSEVVVYQVNLVYFLTFFMNT